jgi:hypothetical protein
MWGHVIQSEEEGAHRNTALVEGLQGLLVGESHALGVGLNVDICHFEYIQ